MLNFCTLFNASYLTRGLVLYDSLVKECSSFHLYVFAFDTTIYDFLSKQNYKHLTVIPLEVFESDTLLQVKPTRNSGEYCWTCTPFTILYVLNNFSVTECIYIDADMYFYSDPLVLWNELGDDKSILITAHRYTYLYDQSHISGFYCVQFMGFKNNSQALKALIWWCDACIEWCFDRVEAGKFGDQKYIDDWTTRFDGVHVLNHLGGGLAPWNIQQYTFKQIGDNILCTHSITKAIFYPVFYHFQGLKFFSDDKILLSPSMYSIDSNVINLFYKPYIRNLINSASTVQTTDKKITNPNGDTYKSISILNEYLKYIKYKIKFCMELLTFDKSKMINRYMYNVKKIIS